MKFSIRQLLRKNFCAMLCCLLLVFSDAAAQTFQQGDLFVAVGNGQVQWRRPSGGGATLIQTLNTGQGGFTTGMAFDASGKLYVTNFSASSVSVFNTNGTLQGTFGSGYSTPESIVFDQAGNVYVGNLGNGIRKYNSAGVFQSTVFSGRTDFFDIAADQCTALYTQEGSTINRHNLCTNTSLSTFASSGGSAFALRIRQNGEVLLANGANIMRFSSAGANLQTYDVAGENSWFGLNLNPDGTSFWSADFGTSNVYKLDIATGNVLASFNTGTAQGNTVFGLAVFGEFTVSVCADNVPSAFVSPSPTCGSTLTATVGSPFSFTVTASDANASDVVTLNASALPGGATLTPPVPVNGNPVSTTFNWTPTGAQLGTHTVSFTAQDKCGVTTCTYTINVIAPGGSIYYSKPTGDLHNVLTWGLNPDGTGPEPSDFNDSTFQLANRPGIYTMTGDWTVNGGTVNIPASSQLQINGFTFSISELAGPGTISGSFTSNLTVIGTNGGNIPLNFTGGANMLNNFTVNRTGTGSVATLGNALDVFNVLTLTTGTLNTGGLLTLKSSAANTARVAPITGAIDGSVTVERYIPMRRAWRILSAPVGGFSGGGFTGQANMTHNQETGQGTFLTSGGGSRPQSFGTATFSLNQAQTALTMAATIYNIDVTGTQTPADNNDNLSAAHIHVGAPPGANAGVRWGFFGAPDNDNNPDQLVVTPFASGVGGTISSTWDLPEGNAGTTLATNLPAILAGQSYINFHTVQFGGGEIRGQIYLQGAGTQTINQAWQEGSILGQSANPNPFPGYGTHITGGPQFGTVANGFDQNPVGAQSSIKEYISNTWQPLPNTNATSVGGKAYMTFVRGNRALPIGYNDVPPSNTTLRAKGPLFVGDQTFQVAGTGFTAIPNPFASPINFATITRNGVQNNFYLWDPKMGGANGVGAYVLLSFNGVSYDVTPASVSPESQYIQSGQGFLVRPDVSGTAGSITIKESDKSATPAMDVFRVAGNGQQPHRQENIRITLKGQKSEKSTAVLDEALMSYSSNYTNKIDNLDAVKAANVNENLAIVNSGEAYMVERRETIGEGDVIQLKLWNTQPQEYVLELSPSNFVGGNLKATLEDKYLHTTTPVDLIAVTSVPFTISSDPASARADRFRVVIGLKNKVEREEKRYMSAYPNPLTGNNINIVFGNQEKGTYNVELISNAGQIVFRKSIQHKGGSTTINIQLSKKPASGSYQMRVIGEEGIMTMPIVIN